jgi:hypothetical protein
MNEVYTDEEERAMWKKIYEQLTEPRDRVIIIPTGKEGMRLMREALEKEFKKYNNDRQNKQSN